MTVANESKTSVSELRDDFNTPSFDQESDICLWENIDKKSNGQCWGIHLKILDIGNNKNHSSEKDDTTTALDDEEKDESTEAAGEDIDDAFMPCCCFCS